MKITSIELNNWRAYSKGYFEFDTEDSQKNCVVIGAANGYGKTSLFEAVTLCMYGKKGLPLLSRFETDITKKHSQGYDKFLAGVIHEDALNISPRKLSAKINFISNDNVKIRVERSWYFTPLGVHKAGDEEFALWVAGEIISPKGGQDKDDWEEGIISEYFVPHSLARFFLFDGEMVRVMARMDMATQVRMGIEGLMGVPILRELFKSLKAYAVKKRGEIRTPRDQVSAGDLARQIEIHNTKIERLNEEIKGCKATITAHEERRRELIDELSSLGTTEGKEKSELYQKQKNVETEIKHNKEILQEKIISEFSLGLVGRSLLEDAIQILDGEKILEDWTSSKNQGDKGYDNFIRSIRDELEKKATEIPSQYHNSIVNLIESSWSSIWYPKPAGCPDNIYFGELVGQIRTGIKEKLSSLIHGAGTGIEELFNELDDYEKSKEKIDAEIKTSESIGPRQETITSELNKISEDYGKTNTELEEKTKELAVEESHSKAKNATLHQITSLEEAARPKLEMAKRAEHLSKMLEGITNDIVPLQSDELAKKMTEVYKNLSNKNIVEEIKIDKEFGVSLINSVGNDIRERSISSGEEQIFSQALISAVVQVSNFDFPMIIDTPLARLDKRHRASILNHFKDSDRQVIFLSTDTEITNEYFDIIKDSVSDTYKLNYENQNGVGYTSIEKGYF